MNNIICIASAVLLNKNNDLLVVRKRKSSYYMLPGGKVETNEKLIDALLRELEEELGLRFNPSDFSFLGTHETLAVNEPNTTVQGNIFLLHTHLDFEEIENLAEIEEVTSITKTNYQNFKLAHLLKEFVLPRWLNEFKP